MQSERVEQAVCTSHTKDFNKCTAIARFTDFLGRPICFNCYCREYFRSSKWERLRKQIIKQRQACEKCGDTGSRGKNGNRTGFNIHHLTYERLGDERPEDLQLLCHRCHKRTHGRTITVYYVECVVCRKVWGTSHGVYMSHCGEPMRHFSREEPA